MLLAIFSKTLIIIYPRTIEIVKAIKIEMHFKMKTKSLGMALKIPPIKQRKCEKWLYVFIIVELLGSLYSKNTNIIGKKYWLAQVLFSHFLSQPCSNN